MAGNTAAGRIGKPVAGLPTSPRKLATQFWRDVADAAKQAPDQWIPVRQRAGSSTPATRWASATASWIRGKRAECPAALRDVGFTAEARDGVLYVQWSAG